MKENEDRWLIEEEVKELTRMALPTLRKHRCLGIGIAYYKISKSVRYKFSDVVKYMEAHRIETHK
jgi:hypothetical protein